MFPGRTGGPTRARPSGDVEGTRRDEYTRRDQYTRAGAEEQARGRHRYEPDEAEMARRGYEPQGADEPRGRYRPQATEGAEGAMPGGRAKRARSSLLAIVALILGVAAVMTVITGLLAGPGLVLGVLAVLFGIGGLIASRRRHVAGTTPTTLGLILGLAAVVLGILAFVNVLPWLTTSTDQVARISGWGERTVPWLFP